MKAETRVMKLRKELEKSNTDTLSLLIEEYDEVTNACTDLYERLGEIDANEQISYAETQRELMNAEKTELKYFLILVAGIALLGGNKRKVLAKIGIHNILAKASSKQRLIFDMHFENVVQRVFITDMLKTKIPITRSQITEILDYRLNNVHYSARIWKNTMALSDKLYGVFTRGYERGLDASRMALDLSNVSGVGYFKSMRLIKTELTAVMTASQLAYYKEAGVKRVRHVSTLDDRTSEICEERDGLIINVEDAVVGESVPPLHPYCRSIIVPLDN